MIKNLRIETRTLKYSEFGSNEFKRTKFLIIFNSCSYLDLYKEYIEVFISYVNK